MSAGPTLNSRLRVLVAKAYKAEKLYASIRNQPAADFSRGEFGADSFRHSGSPSVSGRGADLLNDISDLDHGSDRRSPSGSATLSVFANDVRAKEWQRSHFQLRTALNEILSEAAGARTVQELIALRDRFGAKAAECTALVERETGELLEVAKRKEFAHCLKLALDLVRHNARAQAYSVIVSELNGILDSAPHHKVAAAKQAVSEPAAAPVRTERKAADDAAREKAASAQADDSAAAASSNVIPFSRRAVSGRRR